MVTYVLVRALLVILLVAANAFFAAAEFALVSVRETRIQQLRSVFSGRHKQDFYDAMLSAEC